MKQGAMVTHSLSWIPSDLMDPSHKSDFINLDPSHKSDFSVSSISTFPMPLSKPLHLESTLSHHTPSLSHTLPHTPPPSHTPSLPHTHAPSLSGVGGAYGSASVAESRVPLGMRAQLEKDKGYQDQQVGLSTHHTITYHTRPINPPHLTIPASPYPLNSPTSPYHTSSIDPLHHTLSIHLLQYIHLDLIPLHVPHPTNTLPTESHTAGAFHRTQRRLSLR